VLARGCTAKKKGGGVGAVDACTRQQRQEKRGVCAGQRPQKIRKRGEGVGAVRPG